MEKIVQLNNDITFYGIRKNSGDTFSYGEDQSYIHKVILCTIFLEDDVLVIYFIY